MRLRPAWFMLVLVPLLAAVQLAAQQTQPDSARKDSVQTLSPIEVVGSIRPAAGPAIGSGTPARITILGAREVDAFEPRLLSEVLQQQPGFSAYDDLGTGYKLNLSSRGFYASPVVGMPQGVSIYLDGVRMNEVDASQVNFDLLPMEHIRRIEILSGNGSLLGRNSLGGAINLITDRGDGPPRGGLELSGGSFDAFRGEGNVAGRTNGGVDYYVGGMYNREDGWRQVTGAKQYNGFLNLGKLGDRSGIRFQALLAKSRAETAGSLPESVYLVQPDSNLSAGDYEDLWQVQGSLAGYTQLGPGRASFVTFFRHHEAERFNANQPDDPDAFGLANNNSFGYTLDYRWTKLVGASVLSVRGGVDGSVNRARIDLFADSAKFGGDRVLTTRVRAPIWDVAPFLIADLTTGRLTWSAGVRYDHVAIPFQDLLESFRDTTGVYNQVNPRVGVSADLGRGLSVFGSWGLSFRAPSVLENACADPDRPCPLPFALGDDPPLKAVRASTFEGGVTYASARVYLGLSAYYTDVKDDIFITPNPDGPAGSTIDGYFINLDKTRRRGIEASSRYLFPGGHSLYANYAYTLATFESPAAILSPLNDPDLGINNDVLPGNEFPLVPRHQFKAGGEARLGRNLTVGVNGRFIGTQWVRGDEANQTPKLASYVVTDARVGVDVGPWEVTGIITNLFDKQYANFGTFNFNGGAPDGPTLERFLTPGQKRAFRLVIRRSFGAQTRAGGVDAD
jgi:outer membrane receptor protein involved in Fe transport